jgi:uncharacterized membrane protein YgcG
VALVWDDSSRGSGSGRGRLRLLVAWLFAVALAVGGSLALPTRAFAAADQIDSFDVKYAVQPSGVVQVQETITWRFGDTSGRHGIRRYLITREPFDEKQDAVYTVDNVAVSSPDPVSTQLQQDKETLDQGREEQLILQIGDPDKTISASTATYVISYEVSGAMRTSNSYDEFYWDATGFGNPAVKAFSATATVPGGAQDVTCNYGTVQSKADCSTSTFTKGGAARFGQASLPAKQNVSLSVKVSPGLVAANTPQLEPDGSKTSTSTKVLAGVVGFLTLALSILSPILGASWWRKHGRDRRYAGLAPGTVPLPGQTAAVVANDPDIPIPVAFSPPKIPVAEAGLLVDGQVDARETAATIIDLAVRGGLTVQSSSKDDFTVTLVDPGRATAPHEMVLLNKLFDGQPPGSSVDLSAPGSLQPAHNAMRDSVISQVASRGWFTKVPSAVATRSIGIGGLVVIAFVLFHIGAALVFLLVPLLPVIITIAVVRAKMRRGQRTADGRAVCDQVEGFKTYLATAEAEQLQFEEGEDIFSRYLPWAIAFELADRWAKICGDLVAMGRLPDTTPDWYYGSYNMSAFNIGFLTGSLTSAAAPAPVSGGSTGTGFGGGSSFSGGGFSGGGGGGGGSGSW